MPAILLCRTGDDAGLAHPILEDRCLIGRGGECALSLLHPQLSREHSAVSLTEDGFVVEDLGSRNGTRLNGKRVREGEQLPIRHLDRITLGAELEFILLELARVPSTEVVAAHVLDVSGARVPLQLGENTIGSDEESDLIVTDESVAPVHARLELSSSSLLLRRDPAAKELTVNGEDVSEDRELVDGDYLELSSQAEFGIEIIRGFAAPAADPHEKTTPYLPVESQQLVAEPELPPEVESEPELAPEPEPEPEFEEVPDEVEPHDETLADPDSTATLEAGEIRDALARARERHEEEMARRVKDRKEAQQDSTSGPSGAKGYAIEEDESNSTLKRTWSSKSPSTKTRPPVQQHFQALRRETAARLLYTVPGVEGEQGCLLREGRHLVGRHEGCRVSIAHDSISRDHAEIYVGPQGIVVTDKGSENGTWDGDERIEKATFRDGDSVRFGSIECRFELI